MKALPLYQLLKEVVAVIGLVKSLHYYNQGMYITPFSHYGFLITLTKFYIIVTFHQEQ